MVTIKNKKGREITLLTPREKGKKYAHELGSNHAFTNLGEVKTDESGNPKNLTKEQRAYRAGYLDSRKDIGKAAQAVKKKGQKKPGRKRQKKD